MQSEPSSPQSQETPFPGGELPFTDRAAELQKLRTSILSIGDGSKGTIVLITGEPGIGKTRLCKEAKRFAQTTCISLSGLNVAEEAIVCIPAPSFVN